MERMWPGTRALRTFDAAARHLNFSRAADEVGLTPAAVSHQIKEIEAQLDMVLFVRTSRSIRLTPAGVVLAAAAADALAGLQRATARARRVAREQTELRVSVGARFATHWLLPRLPRFRAEHPAFELSFDITDRLRDFDDDDVDAAIRFGTGRYRDACAQRLFDTSVVAICSPALLSAGPPLRKPRDLLRHTLCHVDCEVDGVTFTALVRMDGRCRHRRFRRQPVRRVSGFEPRRAGRDGWHGGRAGGAAHDRARSRGRARRATVRRERRRGAGPPITSCIRSTRRTIRASSHCATGSRMKSRRCTRSGDGGACYRARISTARRPIPGMFLR